MSQRLIYSMFSRHYVNYFINHKCGHDFDFDRTYGSHSLQLKKTIEGRNSADFLYYFVLYWIRMESKMIVLKFKVIKFVVRMIYSISTICWPIFWCFFLQGFRTLSKGAHLSMVPKKKELFSCIDRTRISNDFSSVSFGLSIFNFIVLNIQCLKIASIQIK